MQLQKYYQNQILDLAVVGSEVTMADRMAVFFFWVLMPCRPVVRYQCFRETYFLY
jgi:hypothetical protein